MSWAWCEHCRDHYPDDHYSEGGYGPHMAGVQYGPTGYSLGAVDIVERLAAGDHSAVEDARQLVAAERARP